MLYNISTFYEQKYQICNELYKPNLELYKPNLDTKCLTLFISSKAPIFERVEPLMKLRYKPINAIKQNI